MTSKEPVTNNRSKLKSYDAKNNKHTKGKVLIEQAFSSS